MKDVQTQNENLVMAERIAQLVHEQGGACYYVGGFVRDRLLGLENKDIDIEVHGVSPETLIEILNSLGTVTVFGESFGIFGLAHHNLDIALPRSERAVGSGHRDFLITADPFIGTRAAAVRRDFTVNALMQDVLTGEILDYFGGREDLKAGILRHVDPVRFAEDPLRVLRGAQFAARFGFRIAPETVEVCRKMNLEALPKERIFGELEKALLKADLPSVFFESLRRMDQMKVWFPEILALVDIPQPQEYHPEGDVWVHTMHVLDKAARIREQAHNPIGLMLSALCHDLGKASTTEIGKDGRLHAYRHEQAGILPTSALMTRISGEKKLKQYVLNMVELHMLPNMLAAQSAGRKSFNHVFDRSCDPEDLLLLCKADALGSSMDPLSYTEVEEGLHRALKAYRRQMARPHVTGADLIAAGWQPSEAFHEALSYAHKLQLAGVNRKETLSQTLAFLRDREKKT